MRQQRILLAGALRGQPPEHLVKESIARAWLIPRLALLHQPLDETLVLLQLAPWSSTPMRCCTIQRWVTTCWPREKVLDQASS
jgi:hypothetical protein